MTHKITGLPSIRTANHQPDNDESTVVTPGKQTMKLAGDKYKLSYDMNAQTIRVSFAMAQNKENKAS